MPDGRGMDIEGGPDALADEDLIRNDMMAQEELASNREGADDVLEADLKESGMYGPMDEQGAPMADAATAVQSLGHRLSQMRESAIDERWMQDENTLLNFGFLNGHHYIEYDRARRAVVPMPAPRSHVRRKVPKFAPWFRAQQPRLSQGKPDSHIIPTSSQQTDRDAAEYATILRDWIEKKAFTKSNRDKASMWQLLGGVAIWYVGVEWEADPEYFFSTGEQMSHRPDLCFEVMSPMEVWVANKHSTVKEMDWIGRDRFIRMSEARAKYLDPDAQEKLEPAYTNDARERGYWHLREIQRLLGREYPWHSTRPGVVSNNVVWRVDEEDDAILCEFWAPKGFVLAGTNFTALSAIHGLTVEIVDDASNTGGDQLVKFPQGLRCVFTPGGDVMEVADNFIGELPFRESKVQISAGFWTPAWATALRELNQAFDHAFSLREIHLDRTAKPIFLNPKEARIHRRSMASGTEIEVQYRANRFGAKPEWANPPTMPQDTIEFLGELERHWQDAAGLHEVSQGKLPAKLSGVAVSLLQEQDLSQLGFAGAELEDSYREILQKSLLLVQKFFPEEDPRLIQLAGDADYRLAAFMQADIKDGLDIEIVEGTGIPRSAAAARAEARELWELGALVDDLGRPDVRKLKVAYQYGNKRDLYFEDDLDKKNARASEEILLALPPEIATELALAAAQNVDPMTGIPMLPPPFEMEPFDNAIVIEKSHRLRLKQVFHDERVNPVNAELLKLRWMMALIQALPILQLTDPNAAAPFMALLGGQEQQGEGGEESESDNPEGT